MRDPSKIDALFPERRPETSQDKSPEELDLENLARPAICSLGLDLSAAQEPWQEAMFQLAFSAVVEEAAQAGHPVPVWEGGACPSEKSQPPAQTATHFPLIQKCWLSAQHQMFLKLTKGVSFPGWDPM